MKYKTIRKGPMQIMGIQIRTSNENWQVAHDLPPFWGRFWRENIISKIPNKTTGEALGLYCEYEKDHTKPYTLVAGCEVYLASEVPEGMVVKHVPASKYAVFAIRGAFPDALMEVWKWVWQGHLERTYTGDYEVYPPGFHPVDQPEMLLYVAIKSDSEF